MSGDATLDDMKDSRVEQIGNQLMPSWGVRHPVPRQLVVSTAVQEITIAGGRVEAAKPHLY